MVIRHFLLSGVLLAGLAATAMSPADAQALPGEQPYRTVPGASPVPLDDPPGLTSVGDLEAFFDGVMAAHLKQNRLAGAIVSVVKDGELFFAKGYGYADMETKAPVDPARTLFRPGSTSKLFTWTALMQLVEQGKVGLDADVNQYLTQIQIPDTFDQPITVRNILTHTPGLEDGGVGYLILKDAAHLTPLADTVASFPPARVRPPTTDFSESGNASYSNWATALGGLIVANVSGMDFDDYVAEHIFRPLEMHHSTFGEPLPADLAPQMSVGHAWKDGKLKAHGFEHIHHFGPAGSLTSNAVDMANFMIAHLNLGAFGDSRILAEDTARLMQSRQFAPHTHVDGSGLGFYETWINGYRTINHGGDTLYFHTNLALLPSEGIGIFVSYNSSNGLGPGIARRDLVRGFMDRYFPADLPVVTPPDDFTDRAARYAGTYRFNRHSYTKWEKAFALTGGIKVAPTKDNTLLIALGGEADQWVEIAPNVFRKLYSGDTLAFLENDAGEITGMVGPPIAFIGAYRLRGIHAPLLHYILLGLGVLAFVISVVGTVRHWKADRVGPPVARHARRVAGLVGVLQILFLVVFGAVLASGLSELIFGMPSSLRYAFALPVLAVPLALLVSYFAWRLWADRLWSLYGRIQYTVIALAGLGFLWSLHYWNLLGWNYFAGAMR